MKQHGDRATVQLQAKNVASALASPAAVLYLLAIFASIVITAIYTFNKFSSVLEIAEAEDLFGYLQNAQDIRTGHAPGNLQSFTFDSPHSRQMLEKFKTDRIPLAEYESAMGPNGYHFVPKTGLIVNQYPPGAGLMLSLFPAGSASKIWDTITVITMCGVGISALAWSAWKLATGGSFAPIFPAVFFGLFFYFALIFMDVTPSYSIEFFPLPLVVTVAGTFVAGRFNDWRAWPILFASGLAGGFLILLRITSLMFIPGFLLLAAPIGKWNKALVRISIFAGGILLGGILPLAVHQARLTGSPFTSTYGHVDATAPTLNGLGEHLIYYTFGFGGDGMPALLISILALAGFSFWRRKANSQIPLARRWIALGLIVLLPMGFLLTHQVQTPYYQIPTLLAGLLVLTLMSGEFAPLAAGISDRLSAGIILGIIAIPLIILVYYMATLPLPEGNEEKMPDFSAPEVFKNPKAWIFADRYSGTLWYYDGIPAMNLLNASPRVQYEILHAGWERGEPQYLLYDNPAMDDLVKATQKMGAAGERIGTYAGASILRISWPLGPPHQ